MKTDELVKRLREYAEWARANEWEVPTTLAEDLEDAAKRVEEAERENVDAAPVRHGRWKKGSGYVCGDYQFFCSFCGEEFWESGYWTKRAKYCLNCGAKMDGENNGEQV